jgi:hypothetical protein
VRPEAGQGGRGPGGGEGESARHQAGGSLDAGEEEALEPGSQVRAGERLRGGGPDRV